MPTLTTTKTYADGDILFESDLDQIRTDIETFLNVTKIDDDNIQDSGITASLKISDGTITVAKMGSDSVSTTKIVDAAVTTAKLADSNVTTAKIADLNVTTGKLAANAVTDAKIRQSAAVSVIGRSANSTGDVADIAAGANNRVLKREGDALLFDTVDTADITDAAVTKAKLSASSHQISASSGSYSSTSYSALSVTNLSATITTTGRPVIVMLVEETSGGEVYVSANGSVTLGTAKFYFSRDTGSMTSQGGLDSQFILAGTVYAWPPSAYIAFDVPSAGTHTYTFRHDHSSVAGLGTITTKVTNCKLVAYEL